MDIRTENLTILFVDIAGFTATTSRQSRAQNAHLLQTFNNTLLPLIKRSGGIVVKSIGDALLITFRSPTDAMLCTMALQDAMHEHNLGVAGEPDRIHIRVAANLGEVRVTKNDIFGEPVNVASRIESITPADEIYLSEAVYMAMNKAEVPAQDAGLRDLAGVSHPVRVYSIPRFAQPRLVPEETIPADEKGELRFPFGGMHHRLPEARTAFKMPTMSAGTRRQGTRAALALAALLIVALGVRAWHLRPVAAPAVVAVAPAPAVAPPVAPPAATSTPTTAVPETIAPETPAPSTTTATTTPTDTPAPAAAPKPAPPPAPKKKPAPAPAPPPERVWSVVAAKAAYNSHELSRDEYRRVIDKLKTTYEYKIRELKLGYREKRITKPEYEAGVRAAKLAYEGR